MGQVLVERLRQKSNQYIAHHLRYNTLWFSRSWQDWKFAFQHLMMCLGDHRFESDMLAFSGCYYGGGDKERRESGLLRKWWKTLHVIKDTILWVLCISCTRSLHLISPCYLTILLSALEPWKREEKRKMPPDPRRSGDHAQSIRFWKWLPPICCFRGSIWWGTHWLLLNKYFQTITQRIH